MSETSLTSSVIIPVATTLILSTAFADTVTFAGSTGTLMLDQANTFTGTVHGLTGQDTIDFSNIVFTNNPTAQFVGDTNGGTLTVSDGVHTDTISLAGDYTHSGWTLSSDGHGGTNVVDPPLAPAISERLANDTGSSATDHVTSDAAVTGNGAANAAVHLTIDGNHSETVMANADGIWSFTPSGLSDGTHTIAASETDAVGNTLSTSLSFTFDATAPDAPTIASTAPHDGTASTDTTTDNALTLTGTSEANTVVNVYDGTTRLGSAATDEHGAWSFTTGALSSGTHTLTATATDLAGNNSAASEAVNVVYGSTDNHTIASTGQNELLFGNGNNNTFVFSSNFGKDTIEDFHPSNDVVQISHDVFSDFANALAHASQVGHDVVITVDPHNSITLHNTELSQMNGNNLHIV